MQSTVTSVDPRSAPEVTPSCVDQGMDTAVGGRWAAYTSLVATVLFVALYLLSRQHYLLFHCLAELSCTAVAWGLFLLVWNSRKFLRNDALVFLGIAYLFVGLTDLVHALAYRGMGLFPSSLESNLATQLWIAARWLESAGLLAFPLLVGRRLRTDLLFWVYAAVTALLLSTILVWRIFPDCYVDGQGLTTFKKLNEYAICLTLAGAIALLYRRRDALAPKVYRLMMIAVLVTIAAELVFTLYVGVYDFPNFLGHCLKLASFFLVYVALIRTALGEPYAMLFRELRQTEAALEQSGQRFQSLALSSLDFFLTVDVNLSITYANRAAPGLTVEQLIGMPLLTYVEQDQREAVRTVLESVLATRQPACYETTYHAPEGGITYFESHAVAQLAGEDVVGLIIVARDITERKQAYEELRRSKELTESIRNVQSQFITGSNPEAVFERLLDVLVKMTGSEFGFLDEVRRDKDGSLYKVSLALSNISWDEESARLYDELKAQNLEFRNLNNLSGAPVKTCQVTISNTPASDSRSGGLPHGHPPLCAFMGIPMFFGGELLGVAGVANRPDGYTHEMATFLEPLTTTCAGIIAAVRARRQEAQVETALKQSEATLNEAQEIAELGSFVWDLRDDSLTWSRNMFAMARLKEEDFTGNLSDVMAAMIHPDDHAKVSSQIRRMVAEGNTWPMEFRVLRPDGDERVWQCRSRFLKDEHGKPFECVGVHYDVTEQRRAESERTITFKLLQCINTHSDRRDLMREITTLIRDWSQCEAVGIRLREGEDFPYFETRGFPEDFVAAENHLCALDQAGEMVRDSQGNPVLECMCGNVICRRYDPAQPFFSANGSFWTNSTTALLSATTEADRQSRTRNRCHGEGYESVALIPLYSGDTTFGLLQLNDSRKGRFTRERIQLLERLAGSLALALAQRQAAEAMAESEAKFRAIFEQAPDSVLLIDAETQRVTEFNRRAHETLGYSREEFAELTVCDYEAVESPQDVRDHMARVEQLGYDTFETRHRARDGSLVDVLVNCTLITTGRRRMFLSVWTDITHRKLAERKLLEEQRFTRSILDSTDAHIAVLDRHGRIVDMNQAWTTFAQENRGRPPGGSWIGVDYLEVCRCAKPPANEGAGECFSRLSAVLAGTSSGFSLEYPCHSPTQQRWFQMRVAPLRNDRGGAVVVHTNITDQKLAEATLLQAQWMQAEAERLAATGRMAAQVAHEINNPLAGIKNSFRLIRDAVPEDHPDHDMVARIEREIDRIAHVVRQMYTLHTARPHMPTCIPVPETVRDVLAMLEPRCHAHNVQIELAPISPDLTVWAPEGSLQQVLYNLTTNALKASPRGGVIQIWAELTEDRFAKFTVRDQGPGIAAEVEKRMFEPFFSAGTGGNMSEGLGLGLSIVKRIVDSLRGRIEFDCAAGQGTTFRVYLPTQQT